MPGIDILSLLVIIWVLAWLKEIRTDTRKIRKVLKKRFPENFSDDEWSYQGTKSERAR